MDGCRDGLSRHDNLNSAKIEERDEQHATVTTAGRGVLENVAFTTRKSSPVGVGHYAETSLLQQDDDSINDVSTPVESENDSSPPTSGCRGGGYMSTDSEDSESFDLLRTLRHYRRSRHHSSSSSECSCESCISHSDDSFFGSEEGPPGGENTVPRRAFLWLENVKVNWGFLVLGLLMLSVVFTVTASVVAETGPGSQVGRHMLYWIVPLMAVIAGGVVAWRVAWHLLLKRGYGKGDHIMERWNLIQDVQAKELVYSVRGAIYAPTCRGSRRLSRPPVYEVVAYESEFDSETYFDSDLESDGQYRRTLTPWREVEDPRTTERHNIYTRRAWFRDVPLVWWELLPRTHRDL